MERFKKIYIEITNICNLNCSFCPKDDLPSKSMSLEEFEMVLKKIDYYTDYVYLHVKGEPLTHNLFDDIISLCVKYNKKINITTNGVLLLKNVETLKKVRQINISLQSLTNIRVLDQIFEAVDELKNYCYISYRLWTKNDLELEIINKLKEKYNCCGNKLADNIFMSFDSEFIWPNLKNKIIREESTCFGTRDHIAILADGTVIPCCLDSLGIVKLGNIFTDSLESILISKKFVNMRDGFKNNVLREELCRKCGFLAK